MESVSFAAMKKLILATLVVAVTACSPSSPPAPPAAVSADAQFATLEHDYVVYMMSRFPVVATYLGGSAFDSSLTHIDGKLRDYSPEALQAEDVRLGDFRARFSALDAAKLSARRRIDRSVALAEIAFLLHQHQVRHHQERSLDSFVDEPFRGIDWQIQGMTSTGAATYGTDAEWQEVIARARAIPSYLAIAEKQLSSGLAAHNAPDWRVLVEFGLDSTSADARYLSNTLPQIAATDITSPQHDALVKDLTAAANDAAAAYMHLRAFIGNTFFDDPNGKDAAALKPEFRADHFVFGEAEYDWALHNNLRLETTAGDLFTQSWPVVTATRDQMVAVAQDIATQHKWKMPADGPAVVRMVFEKLSTDAPKTDAEMVEGYRKTGVELVDYARKTGLFTVPTDYRLDVTETPPPLRAAIEGAAYYPAPPFKKTGVGRFYVTPTGDNIAALRQQHNSAAMADLAAHEGFPGHDWHYKVMTQYHDDISPIRWLTPGAVEDSSSMWQDSMAAEGWALYSESLLAEPQPDAAHGFYSPEQHLYQLRGQILRDLRVRIDTGIHTGRMQFEEAVTLFSEVVDFLPGSCEDPKAVKIDEKRASCEAARRAITRYSRWPTQAITYNMGKDQILALRKRAQQELGEHYSAQRFHLEFMRQGTIPAGYFGDELLQALQSSQ
jgi:uncharacterized protein (DUF885 family)